MENWKLSMERTSLSLVGSLIISRKAVVGSERVLNFRGSDGECLAMGINGESNRQSHMKF